MRAELDYNRADFLETALRDSRTGEGMIETKMQESFAYCAG